MRERTTPRPSPGNASRAPRTGDSTDRPARTGTARRRTAPHRTALGRAVALLVAVVLAVLVPGLSLPGGLSTSSTAEAAVRTTFSKAFQTDDNGAIAVVGNSQMTCPTATTGCTAAKSGSGSSLNNNNYSMVFIDNDGRSDTTNSTSADVNLPSGSTVLYARLIWGARVSSGGTAAAVGTIGTAKFRAPNATAYTSITATTLIRPGQATVDTDPYQASLDVTSTVQAAGNGTYWFADLPAGTGADRYGGWSLIVAYRNPSLPLRNLTVFEGFADITSSAGNSVVTATVSGLLTPSSGTVQATVGYVSWEGDLGSSGDYLKFENTTLADSRRSSTNFFNSSISSFGANITDRSPNDTNNFGVDFGRTSANGALANSATQATVTVGTSSETIYLGAVTTEIDLFTPSFVGTSKTVTNLSGNSPAKTGDVLQYTLSFTNSGSDPASNVVVRDPLPANVSYVPGSMTVVTGANASTTAKTDDVGDDVADYVAADRLVRIRLGTGASGTAGGTLAVNASTSATFRVTVERPAAGTTVTNGSFLDYRAVTIGKDFTFVTNTVSTPVQAIADLAVTKSANVASQTAGSPVTYTLGVTNNGPSTATSVVTTDTLPSGVSYVSSAPPSGTTCSASGQTVTCTTATLANAATLSIPITTTVAPGADAGTVVNTAAVTASTSDDVSGNNTATASTTISRSADLGLTKTGPSSAVAGDTVTYLITATNGGPSSATATSITDSLPVGTSVVSTSPSQGTCSTSGQTVTCALGTVAPAGTATVQIVARIAPAFTGTSVSDTATVSSTTPDPNAANNSAEVTTSVTRDADLAVTQTASPTSVSAGNTVTYTVTVTNEGRSDALGVALADTVPSGFTVLDVTPTQGSCTTAVACDLGTITPGSSARVTILARVASTRDPATGVRNTATATTTTPEADTADNAGSADVTVVTRANLSLTKTGSPAVVQLGTDLTYTLTARNAGPSEARTVVITDTLPNGTTFASGSGCTASGQTVTCELGTLAAGDSATRTVTVSTSPSATGTLSNTATVSSATTDPATGDNTATVDSSTESLADLSLTNTAAPATGVPGQDITYTLTAANRGPSTARGVVVTDVLPASLTYRSSSFGTSGSCTVSGQTVSCAVGTLGPSDSVPITLVARLAASYTNTAVTNTASVAASTPDDPTTSNNTASARVSTVASADVAVTLTPQTPTVAAGNEATYLLSVRNNGPSDAANVQITGQVPDGMEPVLGSSAGACSVSGRTVTCPIPSLPVGATIPITFRATTLASLPAGPITGTAYVGSATPDPDSSNNASSATVTIVDRADLVASSAVVPEPLVAGTTALYTVRATNNGPSDATSVTLVDTLPEGVTVTGVTPSTGSCSVSGRTVSCAADRLSPGGVLTVRISVDIAAADSGSLTNRVVVNSAVTDPDTANNTVSTSTTVVRSADLRLTKTASPTRPVAGSSVQYVLTAVNAGPSIAEAVVLEDTFPAEVTLLPGAVSAGAGSTCTTDLAARSISCALGTLAPGDSRTVAVDVTVSPRLAAGSSLSNTARLTSPTPTQNPDGRTATATGTVATSADVSVAQTAVAESPIAGAQEKYVVTVANGGPSVARNVTVTNRLPDGLSFVSIAGPGAVCTGGAEVSCALGDLDPGQVVVLRLVVKLDPRIAGRTVVQTTNVATTTEDPVSSNNSTQLSQTVSAQNDLEVTKTVTSGPVVAGRPVTYGFTLTNNGPSRATGVTLTDLLPPGLDYSSAAAQNSGYCSYFPVVLTPEDDDLARCVWNTVEVGDTVRASLTLAVPVDATEDVVNTITAASSAADPTPASATVTSPVTTSADLGVTKSLLSGAPVPGSDVRWQISVRNAGPSRSRAVVVSDTAPDGVTFTGVVTSQGGTCAVAQNLSCALGDLTVGATATVTVTGRLSASWAGQSLENSAAATATTADPDTRDNTASVSSAVDAEADLSVGQVVAPATLTPGRNGTWTVTVRNDGPSDARSVVLTDPLPSGVTLVSATLDGGTACTGTTTVRCSIGTLPSGAERVLTLVGRLSSGFAAGSLTTVAEVTAGTADPDGLDNQSSLTTPVARVADLSLTATGPDSAVPGRTASWTLTVANAGPSDTSGAVLTVNLPTGLLDATGSLTGGTCSRSGSTLVCQLGAQPAGDTTAVTVQGRIDPAETADTAVLSAALGATPADPDTDDLTASVTTSLGASADLSITTTAASTDFVAGERAVWNITVRNDGPSLARTVRVVDAAPAGVGDLQVSGSGCSVDGTQVICEATSLAPGATLSLAVSGLIDPGYASANPTGTVDLANTASVSSTTPDPDSADLTSTATTPVGQSADVSLGKALTSGVPVAGEAVSFSLVARNAGPSSATGLVVTDAVPDGIDAVSASTGAGSCQVSGRDVRCTVGDLAVGAQAVITVAGVLDPAFEGALTNRATAVADQDDPASANNTGAADLDADEQADVAVAISGPATLVAGTRGTWTVEVTNRGPSLARAVAVTESLPAALSDLSFDGPAGCNGIDDCVLAELDVDQTVTLRVSAVLAASYAGSSLTVETQADAETSDPSSLDNIASAVSAVQSAADLSVRAVVTPSRLTPGRTGTYTLTVGNDGPSLARRVVLENALPSGLSATGAGASTTSGTCTTVGNQISCDLGSLAAGDTVTVTVPVALAADYPDPTVVTTAVVSSGTADPDDSNNTVVTTVGTDTVADLTLTGDVVDTVEAGTPLGWTFGVGNDGPSDARTLVLTTTLPAGSGEAVAEPTQGSCQIVDSAVTCDLGTVPAGGAASVAIRLVGGLPADYPAGALRFEASVTSPTPEAAGGDAGNDGRSTSISTDVVVSADVSAEKVADAATVQAGGRATWTVTVSNSGPSTARDLVVTDAGGTGLRALTLTDPAAGGAPGVSCAGARCTIASLAPGAAAAVRLQAAADVPSDFAGDRVVNALAVDAATSDPDPGDNTAAAALTVTRSGGLSVAMTGSAAVTPGERASWTVVVSNAGPSLARDVLLLDDLPAALSQISVDAPAGVTCTGDATLRCTLGDLGAGAGGTVTLTISATLDSGYAASTLDNSVAVSSTTPDPDATDNTATTSARVEPVADLSLTGDGPDAVVAGDPVAWLLRIANTGPSQARTVTVTVTVPTGVGEVVGGAAEGGVPCTISGTGPAGTVLTCTISALDAGDDVAVRVRGVVDPAFTGDGLDLTATVTSAATDPVPADNTTSVSSDASRSADLSVTETVDPSPVRAGEPATLTLLVGNTGPSVAARTTLTQVLPAGFTPRAATTGTGSCTIDGQTVRCLLGDLPATGDAPVGIEIAVDVADDVDPDAYTLTATVLSATTDPDLSDNTATVSGDTATSADLRLTKTADLSVAVPGEQVSWTLTARNDGPATARAVTLTDLVPAAVRVTSATATQGDCAPLDATPLVCALGDLRDGQVVRVAVVGVLDEGTTDPLLTNSASLASASTADPDSDDATAQVDLPVLGSADLAVTTVAEPDPVLAGTTITWTVTARNDGPSRARDVTLTHQLPAGVTLVSRTLAGAGSCTDNADEVSCAITALAPGASAVLTVVGTLQAGYAGAEVSSTATVSADVADPDPADNTATATVAADRRADLALTADGPADRVAGQTASWTFALDNSGPSDAAGVELRIVLPAELLDAEVSVGGEACAVADGTATCTIGTLDAGDTLTATVRGRIDPATTADAIALVATASSETDDTDADDLTATASTTLGTSAGLSLTKESTGEPFVAGESVGWVLTVANGGPSVARDVSLTDPLPAGLLDPAVAVGVGTAGAGADCAIADAVLTCDLGDLAAGATLPIRLTGLLDPAYAGATVANTASLTGTTTDPDAGDDVATSTTAVDTAADLAVGKAVTSGPPVAGAPIAFAVEVTNNGPSTARSVVLTDAVPAQVDGVQAAVTGGAPDGRCTVSGRDVTCDLADLALGTTATVAVTGVLAQTFDDELTNTARAASDTADPVAGNDTGSADGTVGDSADLVVSADGPDEVTAGLSATWTVTVRNDGPSDARGVVLTDLLPAGLTDIAVTGADCTTAVRCVLGTLASGASVTITLTATVDPDVSVATLTQRASVEADTADPDSIDNTASATSAVVRAADLQVSQRVAPSILVPGSTATYTVTVRNDGPSSADDVVVVEDLPAGLTLAGTPTIDGADCTVSGGRISCLLVRLAPGESVEVSIPVRVAADVTASTVSTTVSASSTTAERVVEDNTSTAVTSVSAAADLTVSASAPTRATAGDRVTWQVAVRNDGPSDAQQAVLTDTLPAGLGDLVVTADGATCTRTGDELSCLLGVLAPGAEVVITLSTVLPPGYPSGPMVNAVSVSSPTAEPGPVADAGRTDSTSTAVGTAATLVVDNTAQQASAVAGEQVSWLVRVVNDGPSTATAVDLRDLAPAGVTGWTVQPPAGVTCSAGVCRIAALEPGVDNALVFTVSGTLDPAYTADSLVSTATATSPDAEDDATAVSTLPVSTRAAVSLDLTGPDTVTPGTEVSWVLTVTNSGPSVARDLVLTDPLPAAVSGARVVAPAGVSCTGTRTVVCSFDALGVGPGEAVEITITATVDSDADGADLDNTATVTSATPDPDLSDNTASTSTAPDAVSDLRVSKSGPAEVVAGQDVRWRIRVANAGPSLARQVVLTDALPAGVLGLAVDAPAGTSCVVTAGTLRCETETLAVGDSVLVVVDGQVGPEVVAAGLSNVATADSSSTDPDPASNTTDPVLTSVSRAADLSLTKTVNPDPVEAGSPATFTLVARNDGPSTARSATVTDVVPDDFTITGVGLSGGGAGGVGGGTCTTVGQRVSCDLGDLAPQSEASIVIAVDAADDLDPDSFANTASVTSADPDPDVSDNSATAAGDTATQADLSVTNTADRAGVSAGQPISWTVVVRNDGPSTARGVTLRDALPAGVSVTGVITSAGNCAPVVAGVLVCDLGDLGDGAEITLQITGTVDADTEVADLTATAAVAATSTADPDNSDDVAVSVTPVTGSASVSLTMSSDPGDSVVAGSTLTWTLTATNSGPSLARGVVVTDVLPDGVELVAVPDGCELTGRTLRCTVGSIAVGASVTIALEVRVDPAAEGSLTNSAEVSAASGDPDLSDNTATAAVPVRTVADVSVTKTVDQTSVRVGQAVTYRIAVANAGPSAAREVELLEEWPDGVRFESASVDAGSFDSATMLWTIGTLAPGQRVELVIVGTATRAGLGSNSVEVTQTGGLDPAVANGVAAAELSVREDGVLSDTGGPALGITLTGLAALIGGSLLLVRTRRRTS